MFSSFMSHAGITMPCALNYLLHCDKMENNFKEVDGLGHGVLVWLHPKHHSTSMMSG